MKKSFFIVLILISSLILSQETEKITIPNGVVYNYTDKKTNETVKKIIHDCILNNDYSLLQNKLMIGPSLWKKFDEKGVLKEIKTKVEFHIDNTILEGRASQDIEESKKIWDELKKELSSGFIIRKANENELKYYWATISFDIEEPLFIVESNGHNYILNFFKKESKLFWIDEFPLKNTYYNPIEDTTYKTNGEFKTYQNGNEVYSKDKGIKETKLEKVVLLNSDAELKENTSIEDIQTLLDKTNKIFENLFKDSQKSGKIMVQFELGKNENVIQFAVKDDLDLELMKEFEKQVNVENFPKSKKLPIKIVLLYKVNSFDETE